MNITGSAKIPCQSCGEQLVLEAQDVKASDTAILCCPKCNSSNSIDCKKMRDDIVEQLKAKFGSNLRVE